MFYTKLTGPDAVNKFFQNLKEGSRLLVKGERGQSHRFLFVSRNNRLLQLESSTKINPPFFLKEKITVNLQIDRDQFAFESELFAMDRKVFIKVPEEISLFQRRKFERLDTRILKDSKVLISKIDSAPCFLELGLLDFSEGGCALQNKYGAFRLRKDDCIEGKIQLSSGENFNFLARVQSERRETDGYVFGLEFDTKNQSLPPRGFLAILESQVQEYLSTA